MKRFTLKYLIALAFILIDIIPCFSQIRIDSVQQALVTLAKDYPGLDQKVELSITDVTLTDFLNALAVSNKLNISVDESLNFVINNNFTNVTVSDVLIFLAKKYDLDITFVGSIINIKKHEVPPVQLPKAEPRVFTIKYNKEKDQLNVDLKNDTLYQVAKELTKVTGFNVLPSKDIENTLVTGFIQDQSFAGAIDMLTYTNNLKVKLNDAGFYLIERNLPEASPLNSTDPKSATASSYGSNTTKRKSGNLAVTIEDGLISFQAINTPIQDIIVSVSEKLKLNYYLFSDLKGNATLSITKSTYDNFLKNLFNGTEYTFKKENNVYLIGDRIIEGLRSTKVITLKYRTVEKVVDFIPAELKKGVEIKPFNDLNSLIMSGSQPRIEELERFVTQIDRIVPVVSIEVMIIQINNTSNVAKGLQAGLGTAPVTSSGTIFPGLNMTIGSGGINNLLSAISGIGGLSNLVLGRVSPNFYMILQLLETNGALKVRSTPKLATLNGHEATLSIGSTEYYLETQNSVIGTQNPQNITTQQYKSVNADLSLSINPFVSGDEQITLDVKVKQSDFTTRISPTAPPGKTTQDFETMIRVKNEETILLGGLESSNINTTASGVPGLARVPVLKWLFSDVNRSRTKSKLIILIKPTVLY